MSDYTPGPLEITGQVEKCEISGFHAIGHPGQPPTAYVAYKPDAQLYRSAPELLWLLSQFIDHLPSKRDWLDPAIERGARDLLEEFK